LTDLATWNPGSNHINWHIFVILIIQIELSFYGVGIKIWKSLVRRFIHFLTFIRGNMIKLEFHCHTEFSSDSLVKITELIRSVREKKIDRIVVTDHNCISGAMMARELASDLIIVGEEVMTTKGELLAAFVSELVPGGLSPIEAINRLKGQGAFISVSHPFDRSRSGAWDEKDLLDISPQIDAIEIFNSRCLAQKHNIRALEFAKENGLLGTVGSDAHSLFELGRSTQYLPEFNDAEGLRKSLSKAEYDVRLSPFWVHLMSSWAKWVK
jgi:hypothetical protein